jgi:hypothetical protein
VARDEQLAKCIEVVSETLSGHESIVQIRVDQPKSASHADYFRRYKVDIATLNGGATEISHHRCVVVKIFSNFGDAEIDPSDVCDALPNVMGCEDSWADTEPTLSCP